MNFKYGPFTLLMLLLSFAVINCRPKQEKATPPERLYAKFQTAAPSDTLAIQVDTVAADTGRVVDASLFLAAIDSSLLHGMIYEPDTTDFQGRAYWEISLDENFDACLLGIGQGWFKFKYLLIYSKSTRRFTDILPAAYYYGGEGGYVVSESWIFKKTEPPVLLTRYLDRHLRNIATQPEEVKVKRVGLRRWVKSTFQEMPVQDSMRWIQKYPIAWDE